ncbi:hypothetical protein AB0B54_11775 [Microbispora bryophytorum]|uniref:hypothetical protein n=1 Tax=Microbispora bryophytorum TaxID=1460882 RepID=UPI0033E3C11A
MTTSPGEPGELFVPGRSAPGPGPGPKKLYVTDASGNVRRAVSVAPAETAGTGGSGGTAAASAATRTDPGFFRNLVKGLNPLRQQTRTAMAMSGLGGAALALDVAATLNLGNPFLFYDRRELWKEMGGRLESGRSDIWFSYFQDVGPNWKGHAADLLGRRVRFNTTVLYEKLHGVTGEMSGAMHNQFKEVLEYDLSVFGLYAATAPILRTLAAMSAHPAGRVALISQVGVFASALGNLVKQFADVYMACEGDLNKAEQKLNDLRAAFYEEGDPARGRRDLTLTPAVADRAHIHDYWQPVIEEPR